jgi:hypothetical protein
LAAATSLIHANNLIELVIKIRMRMKSFLSFIKIRQNGDISDENGKSKWAQWTANSSKAIGQNLPFAPIGTGFSNYKV